MSRIDTDLNAVRDYLDELEEYLPDGQVDILDDIRSKLSDIEDDGDEMESEIEDADIDTSSIESELYDIEQAVDAIRRQLP